MQGWLRENCRKGGIAEDSRNSSGIKENYMKDNNNKKEVAKVILVLAVIIVACICGQLFVGCSPRITPPAEIRDSVRVEIRERVVHDTAYVDVPLIKEMNVTRDTSSHLENEYAMSDASISDGTLRHSLETRPHKIAAPVTITVHDTLTVEKKAETIIKEVNVLTKWQGFQIILGRILGGLFLLIIVMLVVRAFFVRRLTNS